MRNIREDKALANLAKNSRMQIKVGLQYTTAKRNLKQSKVVYETLH